MKPNLKFNLLLLILLISDDLCIEATFRIEKYTALRTGQNITGKVTDINAFNTMDCLRR